MLRPVIAAAAIALGAWGCGADRCRTELMWAAGGVSSGRDLVFPHPAFLEHDSSSATGRRATLPRPVAGATPFASAFERLDGLGLTGPYFATDDWLNQLFHDAAQTRFTLIDPRNGAPVALRPFRNAQAGIRGAQPVDPLDSDADYWLIIAGEKAALLACNDGSVIALSDHAPERSLMEARARKLIKSGERAVVIPFRTQSVVEPLLRAAARIDASTTPRIRYATGYAPLNADGKLNAAFAKGLPPLIRNIHYGEKPYMPLDHVALVVKGSMDSIEFRQADRIDGPDPVDHGHRTIDFILTLPAPATAPVPLILFSHPLRACKEAMLGLADTMAQYGFAMAAIDHVEHGSRQTNPPSNYICGTSIPWAFFGYGNPETLRDNIRASALDLYQFKVALQSAPEGMFDFDGDGRQDFDAANPGLVAMSLGSIIAAPFLALAPDVGAVVLNTALGTAIELLDQQAPGASRYQLPYPGPLMALNLAVVQTILEAGEPINYAAALAAPPRDILVQQVVDDPVVPNDSTAKMARALGLTLADGASYIGNPTRALVQVKNVNHSFLLIPRDKRVLEPARRQVAHFMWSRFARGHAEVISMKPPAAP